MELGRIEVARGKESKRDFSEAPIHLDFPPIKGAKLVFYISWESGIRSEDKIEPYRAQVVARAVENGVYVVHANAPQSLDPVEGSHGQSRIVSPRGVLLQEASMMSEQVLIEDLDLTKAKRINAPRSFRAEFLREWWQNGLEKVAMPGTGIETSRDRQPLK